MEALLSAMYAFVHAFLILPSLLFDLLYKLGPVIAPMLGLAVCVAFPFIALRDKTDA